MSFNSISVILTPLKNGLVVHRELIGHGLQFFFHMQLQTNIINIIQNI